jgi:hypothetical protein
MHVHYFTAPFTLAAGRPWKKNYLSLTPTVRLEIPLGPPSTQSEGGGREVAEDSTNLSKTKAKCQIPKALFIFSQP